MSLPPSVNTGSWTPWVTHGDFNQIAFAIQQALNKVQTATLVRVESCTTDGSAAPIGTVNVTPLVGQVDALGKVTPHTTVFSLPYLRLQAGANGIIIDPQQGDIGIAVFCSRDISSVVSTQDAAGPGSGRKFSFSDGIYLGAILSAAAPTQYLQFNDDGITLKTTQDFDATASGNVNIKATGNIIMSGDSIQAGGSPSPVVTKAFITEWINGLLRPALATAGIIVPAPGADAVTTTFEAS